MKLKLFIIYMLLSFICTEISAQTPVNHGCYWPPKAPNGVVRTSRDSTSEDWWYDFKPVPEGHATFDTGGRYICAGYSMFDDIGVGGIYTNDPCNTYSEINFLASYNYLNFELPDMRHLNACGTIGLVNLTRTTSGLNPYVWILHYGKGTILIKVIPTSDGGFLATGITTAFNIPYPTTEPQFANYFATNTDATIYHQTPSTTTGSTAIFNQFTFPSCLPAGGYDVDPKEPDTRWTTQFKRRRTCLVKVDGNGSLQWIYTYGPVQFTDGGVLAYKNSSEGTDLVETTDGYIVAGIMQNSPVYGNLGNHPFLLKVNTSGTLQWLRQYPDGSPYLTEKFMAIQMKNDSIVYAVGERSTTNSGVFGAYPNSSSYLNGNDFADKEHYRSMKFLPFLKKINIATNTVLWDYALETNTSYDYKARDLAIDANDNILVPVSSECKINYEQGECKSSHVDKVVDNGTFASSSQKIEFGPMRAYDLNLGLGVKATTDGGFTVVGTKKTYDLNIAKDYSSSPFGSGYDMRNFAPSLQSFTQTDGFVAKCNSSGNIEWTSISDNTTPTPGGSFRSTAGNPRNQTNIDNWMNYTTTRSKRDIKRQECFYTIATSYAGEIVIGGNMSANIDDDYLAMVENSCKLTLSNHLIQSINTYEPPFGPTPVPITNMNNFVASIINTGRTPGNTYDVAEFIVTNNTADANMNINIEAGEEINMYEGTDLDAGTIVDIHINPSHTCTSGPVYTYNAYTPSFNGSAIVKDKKTVLPANVKPQVIASPNPTTGLITIKHPAEIKQLEVFDLYGKKIFQVRANGSGQTKIDFTNTPAGMYLLRMENRTESIKIVKQ